MLLISSKMRTDHHPKIDKIWSEFCDEAKCGHLNYEQGCETFEGSTFIQRVPLINVEVLEVKEFRYNSAQHYLQADEFPSELNIPAGTWIPRIPELEARGRPYLGNFYGMWTHENCDSHHALWSRSDYANLEEIAWRLSLAVKNLKQIPTALTIQVACYFGRNAPSIIDKLDERMKEEFRDSQCESGYVYCVNLFGERK